MPAIITESNQEIMLNTNIQTLENGPTFSLPPLHTWSASLKRLTFIAGLAACLGAYGLFLSGILGAVFLLLQFAFKG